MARQDNPVLDRGRRLVAATGALALCVTGLLAVPRLAVAASTCSGSTVSWTGQGTVDDQDWGEADNWSTNAVPGPDDMVVLPGGSEPTVSSSTTICSLDVQAVPDEGTDLTIDAGATLTATATTTFHGGPASNEYTQVQGSITTGDLQVLSGYTDYDTTDSTVPALISAGTFELSSGAHFTLGSSASNLKVSGASTLGGSGATAYLNSNSSDNAQFATPGPITLGGTVSSLQLQLVLAAGGTINTAGHVWTMGGDNSGAPSSLATGTSIISSPKGGSLGLTDQTVLMLAGTTAVGPGATLKLQGDAVLSDGKYTNAGAANATLNGPGTFNWTGNYSQVMGNLTLGKSLVTTITGSGSRDIAAPPTSAKTRLINRGKLTISGGLLDEDDQPDTFENAGTLIVTGGSIGSNTSSAPALINDKGATWTFAPTSKKTTIYGSGTIANSGTLVIAAGVTVAGMNNYRQTSTGVTRLTIAGIRAGQFSRLTGVTHVYLGGTLALISASSYKPKPTVTVKNIITSEYRTGTFAHASSTTRRAKTVWTVGYHAASANAVLKAVRK